MYVGASGASSGAYVMVGPLGVLGAKAAENALVTEKNAEMAHMSISIAPIHPIKQSLLDKHYFRKHGANAYYGQGN